MFSMFTQAFKELREVSKLIKKKYFFLLNKHDPKLINILENQKIYGDFLKILIFRVSLSRIHLQSKTFLLYIQGYKY